MSETENRHPAFCTLFEWLFFLYPISLAVNKTANDVISVLIFSASCVFLASNWRAFRTTVRNSRMLWIVALCLPLVVTAIQWAVLTPPLGLRDFDDVSRFFLCIPVYLALLTIKPGVRKFLWGCALFTLLSVPLMFWHLHVQSLPRGVPPNGFIAIIPHTSLAIIFGVLALRLSIGSSGLVMRRLLPGLLIGCMVGLPLLTQTRSGLLLALALGLLLWLLLPNRRLKPLLYVGGAALAVMALVVTNSQLWPRGDHTLAEISEYATSRSPAMTSATTRIELWRQAGKMAMSHPVIGVGNNRFRSALVDYQTKGETPPGLDMYTHPHNEFLKAAAEGGLLGILSLTLLFFVPLTTAVGLYRKQRSLTNPALLVIGLVSGFMLAGLVDVVLIWRPTILFYGLAASLLLVNMDSGDARIAS